MKTLLAKIVAFYKWIWRQLKDWRNLLIFLIVTAVLSCEVWVPYIIAIVTGNRWWFGVGSACWAFWLAPFTPFTGIALALTFIVRRFVDKIRARRHHDD